MQEVRNATRFKMTLVRPDLGNWVNCKSSGTALLIASIDFEVRPDLGNWVNCKLSLGFALILSPQGETGLRELG